MHLAIAVIAAAVLVGCSTGTPVRTQTPPTGGSMNASEIPLANAISSSPIAVSPDGTTLAVVNPDSDTITLLDATTLKLIAEVKVGRDPRTLAFTPDSAFVLVANHGGGGVSAVSLEQHVEWQQWESGPAPYGVVTDGRVVYVAGMGDRSLRVIKIPTGVQLARITFEDEQAGLALSSDGSLLAMTSLFTGDVRLIDTASLIDGSPVTTVVSTGADSNMSQFVAYDPSGERLLLPQTRSNAGNLALVFDATVFPVVNSIDLATRSIVVTDRITLDTADQPVSMPFGVVITPDHQTMYVVNASSNDVSVIDLETNDGLAHLQVGANPRGIAISPDGSRVFVANVLDGTVSVVDTASQEVTGTVTVTDIPLPPEVLLGKQLFNAALEPRMTTDNWISCAVCHFDGTTDKQTWLGFPDGPRNTPSLLGVVDTLPAHWSGDLDELADVELTIRNIQAGSGLFPGDESDSLGEPHAGRSADLDALVAFMETLEITNSPFGILQEVRVRGEAIFQDQGCAVCHAAPLYTDRRSHDVGTGDPALERNSHGRGTSFDTPSLRGLWATEPYLHDGSAETLADVLNSGNEHNVIHLMTDDEIVDLFAFLRSLD